MKETPAKGARGYLLYNATDERYFFQVYDWQDKRNFTDYALAAEEIEIEIVGTRISLYQKEEQEEAANRLGWASEVSLKPKSR